MPWTVDRVRGVGRRARWGEGRGLGGRDSASHLCWAPAGACAAAGTHRTALTRCHRPSWKEPLTTMDATPLPRL